MSNIITNSLIYYYIVHLHPDVTTFISSQQTIFKMSTIFVLSPIPPSTKWGIKTSAINKTFRRIYITNSNDCKQTAVEGVGNWGFPCTMYATFLFHANRVDITSAFCAAYHVTLLGVLYIFFFFLPYFSLMYIHAPCFCVCVCLLRSIY